MTRQGGANRSELPLTPEQEAEAEALVAQFKSVFEQEAWQMARFLVRKEDRQRLGGTEFAVRERRPRLGAQVGESVLQERKKRRPRGKWRLSALRGAGPLWDRAGHRAGEFAGARAVRAGLLPVRGVWARGVSVGGGARSDGGDAESGGGGSRL